MKPQIIKGFNQFVNETNGSEDSRNIKDTLVKSMDWGNSNKKLERTFKFKDFNESMDFVNKVAKIAEDQQHHPDIEINFDKVTISITDHEKGGVSDKCHKFVKSIDNMVN
jgi:4a-hydroxytetrahydrobiopterin dehydratase